MVNITPLAIENTPVFWPRIHTSIAKFGHGTFSDNGLIFVAMPDKTRMIPFVRNKEELFTSTIKRHARKFKVIINGQFYDLSKAGIADALWGTDPVDPSHTTPEGLVIRNGKSIGGRPAPLMFHIANYWKRNPKYQFGSGVAPLDASAAIGGCGPIIINGLPYGETNRYKKGKHGNLHGRPSNKNLPFLTQLLHKLLDAGAFRAVFSGARADFYNRSIAHSI